MAAPPAVHADVTMVPAADLLVHPDNPRQGDIGAIMQSIEAHGFYGAVIVQQSTGHVLVGNHRLQAAQQLGLTEVPAIYLDISDHDAKRVLLADNRTNDLATYDDTVLAGILEELAGTTAGLDGTGYDGDDLDALLEELGQGEPGPRGENLDLLDVSIADPKHQVENGDVWKLGEHVLVCADVHHDFAVYVPWLEAGTVFAPYPTPMLPLVCEGKQLVMVQPDRYLAGHVLDKWCSRHGEGAAVKL